MTRWVPRAIVGASIAIMGGYVAAYVLGLDPETFWTRWLPSALAWAAGVALGIGAVALVALQLRGR